MDKIILGILFILNMCFVFWNLGLSGRDVTFFSLAGASFNLAAAMYVAMILYKITQ